MIIEQGLMPIHLQPFNTEYPVLRTVGHPRRVGEAVGRCFSESQGAE